MPHPFKLGICSFSFHHMLASGEQDVFGYIDTCRQLGCTQLDPWNAHLSPRTGGADVLFAGRHPGSARLDAADDAYIEQAREAAAQAGLPWGILAADGACIYEADEAKRAHNRQMALRWIGIAGRLGAAQIRIDAGGPPDLPPEAYRIIRESYREYIDLAGESGVEVIFENHFGPSTNPDHVLRMLDDIEGLGYLFDTNNWMPARQLEGWERCAPRARACHIKTFAFDRHGKEPSVDLPRAIGILRDSGYTGAWGVESVLREPGDEIGHARRTIELIRREVLA